mmetsp:Transcript_35947/g.94395  ORF Transcript_35947/g.94395 Transcript_35947/m.94395 type:complete len:105 (-) Transcript_35947:758-1072(-)
MKRFASVFTRRSLLSGARRRVCAQYSNLFAGLVFRCTERSMLLCFCFFLPLCVFNWSSPHCYCFQSFIGPLFVDVSSIHFSFCCRECNVTEISFPQGFERDNNL